MNWKPGTITKKLMIPQSLPNNQKREWLEKNEEKPMSIMKRAPYHMRAMEANNGRRKETEKES